MTGFGLRKAAECNSLLPAPSRENRCRVGEALPRRRPRSPHSILPPGSASAWLGVSPIASADMRAAWMVRARKRLSAMRPERAGTRSARDRFVAYGDARDLRLPGEQPGAGSITHQQMPG